MMAASYGRYPPASSAQGQHQYRPHMVAPAPDFYNAPPRATAPSTGAVSSADSDFMPLDSDQEPRETSAEFILYHTGNAISSDMINHLTTCNLRSRTSIQDLRFWKNDVAKYPWIVKKNLPGIPAFWDNTTQTGYEGQRGIDYISAKSRESLGHTSSSAGRNTPSSHVRAPSHPPAGTATAPTDMIREINIKLDNLIISQSNFETKVLALLKTLATNGAGGSPTGRHIRSSAIGNVPREIDFSSGALHGLLDSTSVADRKEAKVVAGKGGMLTALVGRDPIRITVDPEEAIHRRDSELSAMQAHVTKSSTPIVYRDDGREFIMDQKKYREREPLKEREPTTMTPDRSRDHQDIWA
jgi:hypothetical protein